MTAAVFGIEMSWSLLQTASCVRRRQFWEGTMSWGVGRCAKERRTAKRGAGAYYYCTLHTAAGVLSAMYVCTTQTSVLKKDPGKISALDIDIDTAADVEQTPSLILNSAM